MNDHTRSSTRTSQVIRADAEKIYTAFLDPAALVEWLPPAGMTERLHAFDGRTGGGYEMSLYYSAEESRFQGKTGDREDRVVVRFVELTPPRRIVERIRFVSPDPAFQGEMSLTVTIEPGGDASKVTLAFDGLPPGIRPEDNDAGARQSLLQLAKYVAG